MSRETGVATTLTNWVMFLHKSLFLIYTVPVPKVMVELTHSHIPEIDVCILLL